MITASSGEQRVYCLQHLRTVKNHNLYLKMMQLRINNVTMKGSQAKVTDFQYQLNASADKGYILQILHELQVREITSLCFAWSMMGDACMPTAQTEHKNTALPASILLS